MPKINFIHTADIHLDTPFKGLTAVDIALARHLKKATFQSFDRIVDLCLQESVDFLLIAGDTFDGEARSLSAQLGFVESLRRLSQVEIPVYLVFGNHDPAETWLKELPLPDNVHCFSPVQPESITHFKNGEALADIHGISFDSRSGDDNPTTLFQRKKQPAPFSIGLLHGTIGPAGPHTPYGPFTAGDILEKGFDYWALGHVHNRRVIRGADPAIVYSGNPQGRDFGETGPRGCCRVTLETGQKPDIVFVPTCTVRFETVSIDLTGIDTLDRLPEIIDPTESNDGPGPDQTGWVVRLVLKGRTPLHAHFIDPEALGELAQWLNESLCPGSFYHIDRIESETLPDIDLDSITRGNDFPADVLNTINAWEADPETINGLIRSMAESFANHAIRKETGPLDDKEYRRIADRARRQLIDLFFT